PSPTALRRLMVDISKSSFRRSHTSVDRTRFLLIDQGAGESETSALSSEPSSRSSASLKSTLQGPTLECQRNQFKIGRRSSLRKASSYVAVSYCWNRSSDQPSNDRFKPVEISCEDLSTRKSATPPDVLHRSMAYAVAHHVKAIWIDQECIDQDDPIDKEESIQEMDIIYQESDHPIAVLEFCFDTQAQLDAFSSICDDDLAGFDPDQIEVLESVLIALNEDRWFERAWTLQESVSAGVSMTLLLGCPGLQKSPHFGVTPDEFAISIWDFQNAMVSVRGLIEEGLAADIWPDKSSAIFASNCADILWNCMPTDMPENYCDTPSIRNPSHRQICNAAQALTFLYPRSNSVFQDRLAILANLCNYECRIDTNVLRLPDSSFTICVHTLAILNGDMSLLGGYADKGEPFQRTVDHTDRFLTLLENARADGRLVYPNDNADLRSNTYGFSWGPRPSACLRNLIYIEEWTARFRLKPATLSMQGLRNKFSPKWQEELRFLTVESDMRGNDRQKSLVRDFLWSLLQEVYSSGLHDLAKTLWNFFQPVGFNPLQIPINLGAPLPYSFDMMFGESACSDKEKQAIVNHFPVPDLWFDPSHAVFNQPSLERLLIEVVCRDGALLCSSPANPHERGSSSLPQPYAWFEACNFGDKVFTPVTDIGDRVPQTRYLLQAMSWKVLETGHSRENDCKILHCLGRRRGIWRTNELTYHQDHILD
ncbi:MAG: hypothetical protein L6R41_006379, partial [Letrouitia leprolyta]